MDNKESLGIAKRYSSEIREIANKLNELEKGRIYEFTNVRMDGALATNIKQLHVMISGLLSKIDRQQPSIKEEQASLFKSNNN